VIQENGELGMYIGKVEGGTRVVPGANFADGAVEENGVQQRRYNLRELPLLDVLWGEGEKGRGEGEKGGR